jgi:ribosomal protein S18 acetylase RimI-like enzyme
MSIESNTAAVPHFRDAFNAGDLSGVGELTTKDTDWAAKVLEQAFYTDPLLNFIYGDTIGEPGKLNWFFRTTFRLAALYGDCLATAEQDGVLMMLPPDQTKMTAGMMLKSGLLTAPFKMGWASFSRMMRFMDFAEKEHKAAASFDHYYIMTVGVLPERQGRGVGKKLMTRALEMVDADQVACYLETQNQSNVPIYQKLGFEVVSDNEMPSGGLHNWGMLRQMR